MHDIHIITDMPKGSWNFSPDPRSDRDTFALAYPSPHDPGGHRRPYGRPY